MKVVILAGGKGLRLWPLSRMLRPKQFVKMAGKNRSSFQDTLKRVELLSKVEECVVVCPKYLVGQAKGQIYELHETKEYTRETTFAVEEKPLGTLGAALKGITESPRMKDETTLVLSADQEMNHQIFQTGITKASQKLSTDTWVIFGTKAKWPNSNMGYFNTWCKDTESVIRVKDYIEKPAQPELESGYWNCGMFLFKDSFIPQMTELFIQETPQLIPIDMVTLQLQQMNTGTVWAYIFPDEAQWTDEGTWDQIYQNTIESRIASTLTRGPTVAESCKDSLLYSDGIPIVGVGLENIVVVATNDVVMAMKKGEDKLLKQTVENLLSPLSTQPYKEEKPWGQYEVLKQGLTKKIKEINIKPGQRTSIQWHQHREEIITVTEGAVILLYRNNKTERFSQRKLGQGESFLIPCNFHHQIINPEKTNAVLIEYQKGVVDEADIVRIEDKYGR